MGVVRRSGCRSRRGPGGPLPAALLLATLPLALSGAVSLPGPAAAQPPEQPAQPAPGAVEILEAADVGGLEAHSAALILSGQQGGELAASVLVAPFPGPTPDTVRLALVVDLAGASLLAPGGEEATAEATEEAAEGTTTEGAGEAEDGDAESGDDEPESFVTEVHAYAVGPDDGLAAHFTQAFPLNRGELSARDGWVGVKFLGVLDVPPGEWSVRLLVRQRRSGRLALRAIPVTAPDFSGTADSGDAEPVLLPPLFPEPTERWTLVRQSGTAGLEGAFPLDLGAAVAGAGELVPSTRPVVEPGGRAFYLVGRGLAGSTGEPGWIVRTYEPGTEPLEEPPADPPGPGVPGDDGTPVSVSRLGVLSAGSRELDVLEVSLDPEALRPGAGTLAISGPAGARASLPAVVMPPGVDLAAAYPDLARGAPLWPDLMSLRETPAPLPVPVPRITEAAEINRKDLARFQVAYLGALEHLATGDRTAAVAAVGEVERSGLARGTAVDLLARGQLQVALDVSGGAAERLLPLIQLHEDLYAEHRQQGDPTLAAHARRVTLGLIDLYVRQGNDEDRGRVAAAALVGVAGQLLAYGNTLETFGILELALEHDPDHPAALLLLGAIYELLGEYREAVDLLRSLEAVTSADGPVGAEGRLRLGINLRRLGSTKTAAEYLETCLAAGRPGWIRAVAYEELAALHLEEDRPQRAVRLLEQALERMPHQQRLYIQLAAIHESLGRPTAARAVLDDLEERVRRGVGRDRDSPRLRYSQWPQEAIDRSRELFDRAAAARLSSLAEALTSFTARGG